SGHHAAIRALAFDPSGGTLVSADSAAEVIRWNINGDRQSSLELDGTPLAFDPTTQRLAIGRVNRIDVVDTATGAPTMLSVTTANPVQSSGAAFSPNGLVLAVGLDSQVTLWDVTSGLQEGKGLRSTGSAPVEAVAFTEDGDRLVGKDLDGFVCTWDVSTSSVIACLDVGGGPYQLATGPDARTATSGDLRSVEVLDNTTGESWGAMYGSGSNVSAISFGAEKGQIVSGDADGLVIVWDLYAGSGLMQAFGHVPSSVDDSMSELSWASVPVAFSPDGRHMAVAGPQETAVWEARVRSSTGEVTWGTVANVAVALDSPGDAVAFAPDGETLVTASNETGVVQWDANTGEKVGEALVEPNEPSKDAVTYGLAVTPDGLTLIEAEAPSVGDGNLRIRTWDAGTGSLRDEESAASVHDLTTMVLAATNSTVAYSTGTEVALEDLTTHRVLHTIDAGGDVQALAVSPDGRMLATIVGRRVRLWDVGSAEQLGELAGHGEDMMSVAFSADGTMLATGAFDASFSLWDVATRRQIGPSLIAPASIIRSVGFVADDNMLAAVGEDVMFSYDLNVNRWLERACAVANHNLTEAEWEQYLPTAKYRITCPDVVTGESP
ncbi:MAG: WD40 repeat domain-containing protein, partial [Ilumatobacteraceae bacterium]